MIISKLLLHFVFVTGFPDAAQLTVIIRQNEQQIQQIRELLEKTKMSADEVRQARQVLQQLTQGVDRSLDLLKNSKEYEEIIQKVQKKNNFRSISAPSTASYNRLEQISKISGNPPPNKEEHADFDALQRATVMANSADLEAIKEVEPLAEKGTPYDLQRLSTGSSLAQWKALLRMSSQLTQTVAELRALREEVLAQRLKEEAASSMERKWLSEALGQTGNPSNRITSVGTK